MPGGVRQTLLCTALLVASCAAQYGTSGGGAYEAELRRRQMEYAQQQAMRQQYAQQQGYGGGQQQSNSQAQRQAQAQAAYQQQLRAAQQQKAAAAQQALREDLMRQQMAEAYARQAQQGGKAGGPSAGGRAMTAKQKKEVAKRQAAQKKQAEQMAKAKKADAAKRQRAYAQAQRKASKAKGGMRPSRGGDKGPLGFVFSVKGAVLLGGVGYLAVMQKPLMMRLLSLGLKYPLMFASFATKQVWTLLLKPILRKLVRLRGASGVAGAATGAAVGGELPGGSY